MNERANIQALSEFQIGVEGRIRVMEKDLKEVRKDSSESKTMISDMHTFLVGKEEYGQKGFIEEHRELKGKVTRLEDDKKKAIWYVRGAVAVTGFNIFTSVGFKALLVKIGTVASTLFS